MSKSKLKDELVGRLTASLETMEHWYEAAREGATHEEAKPEDDKDTRALEQSYLARGQAARIEELRAGRAEVLALSLRVFDASPAALGAVVLVDEEGSESRFFLAPHGGGERLADGTVLVLTPQSPLGRALLGKRDGEEVEVAIAGKKRQLVVVRVH